jgi:hypothetical protein
MKNRRRLLLSTHAAFDGIQPQPDFDPNDPES